MTKLRDIMSKNLVTVQPDTTVQEVAQLMKQHDIGNVLVTENNQLRGIVTDRDIVVRLIAENGDPKSGVRNLMSENVTTLDADTDVNEASRLMASQQIRRLPVVENGQPVGIVSLGDVAVRTDGSGDERALEGISKGVGQANNS